MRRPSFCNFGDEPNNWGRDFSKRKKKLGSKLVFPPKLVVKLAWSRVSFSGRSMYDFYIFPPIKYLPKVDDEPIIECESLQLSSLLSFSFV